MSYYGGHEEQERISREIDKELTRQENLNFINPKPLEEKAEPKEPNENNS